MEESEDNQNIKVEDSSINTDINNESPEEIITVKTPPKTEEVNQTEIQEGGDVPVSKTIDVSDASLEDINKDEIAETNPADKLDEETVKEQAVNQNSNDNSDEKLSEVGDKQPSEDIQVKSSESLDLPPAPTPISNSQQQTAQEDKEKNSDTDGSENNQTEDMQAKRQALNAALENEINKTEHPEEDKDKPLADTKPAEVGVSASQMKKKSKSHHNNKKLAAVVVVVVAFLLAGVAVYVYLSTNSNTQQANVVTPNNNVSQESSPADISDIDEIESEIDSTINSLNSEEEFSDDSFSDASLGL